MTYEEFRDGLRETEIPLFHILAAPEDECPILCWQELTGSTQFGDNGPIANLHGAQVDYFTTTEYDTEAPAKVEAALTAMDTWWQKEAMTYDPDREEWRHIWRCTFFGG